MTSPAKAAANVKNAEKSTGPRTPEGKARAARNALKHGLTARDAVLPNEDPAAFEQQMSQWVDYFQTENPAQLAVIERAVSSKWKLDRCTRLETDRLAVKVRHALDHHDLEKHTEAEEIGRRLIFEPLNRCKNAEIHDPIVRARMEQRAADNPAILTRQLQMTAQGVDWLIARWLELGEMLKEHGYWHYPEKYRAIWMLGKRPEDLMEDLYVQHVFLNCNIAHPGNHDTDPEAFSFLDECIQTKLGLIGKPMYYVQVERIKRFRPANVETAQAYLWEIFTKEITRLRELKKTHLDALAAADRASAQQRAMFDDSHTAVLLRRYESACERELHRSVADLMKLRKESVPAPATAPEAADSGPVSQNEPIAEPAADESVASNSPRRRRRPRPSPAPVTVVEAPAPRVEAVSAPELTPAGAV